MKYICHNPECPKCGVEEELTKEIFVFRNGHLVGQNCPCPKCGKEREEINPAKDIPLSEKNIEIAQFSGMSMEQKREALKKRSREHFQKEIKERKYGLLNQAMTEMRNIKKGN